MPLLPRGSWFARVGGRNGLLCDLRGPVVRAEAGAKADQKPDPAAAAAAAAQAQAEQQEIQSLVRVADSAMSGQTAPSDFPIQYQNDFLKAQGSRVWVPIILTLDPAKTPSGALTLYLRVTPRGMTAPAAPPPPAAPDKNARTARTRRRIRRRRRPRPPPRPNYPFEDASVLDVKPAAPGQPLRIQRGIGVPAGSYDLYIVLHERAGAGPGRQDLRPEAAARRAQLRRGEFSTSTVILAERVDQLPAPISPDAQSEHPYAFGQTEIVVAPDHKFKKSQELIVLLQIYNPMVAPEKKFNLEATYTFYRQDAGTEKRFNSTEPQTFSSDTMGAGFDPTGNSSIQAGQGVPLQSFPEGPYRLEIKITDKLSSKVLTQNVNFTVAP